jgi:hypothetical protein
MNFQEQALINAVIAMFSLIFFLLFFAIAIKQRQILDRYRLKFGFNREIELKEIDGKDITDKQRQLKQKRLDTREKAFKRRTLTD